MSSSLISRSPDLGRLLADGYEVEVRGAYLLVHHVPFVNTTRQVKFGTLASDLTLSGEETTTPGDHVVMFSDTPCDAQGKIMNMIIADDNVSAVPGGPAMKHRFSHKPAAAYPNYYEKMTAYINILTSQAQALDPTVTARTFEVSVEEDESSPFEYRDTASTRAGIATITEKLAIGPVAIIGLGGTGSYLLDFVAKTPVAAIHLFDGDILGQHNAFRSPGAPSVEELRAREQKSSYFAKLYGRMKRNVHAHGYLDEANVELLRQMQFVFIAIDSGTARRLAVEKLTEFGIPFIDVGMGIFEVDGKLSGVLRVIESTEDCAALRARLPFSNGDGNDDYSRNIQIAELNALNAALAVIRWKKSLGFYLDAEGEHSIFFEIDGNNLINEDHR